MNARRYSGLLAALALFSLAGYVAGCSVSHRAMRGSVVAMVNGEAHICIGTYDGLKVGDTLAVFRTRQLGQPSLPYGPYRGPGEIQRSFRYGKVRVGTVKVTRIFDEHFAAVEAIAGEVDFPDIVEKRR